MKSKLLSVVLLIVCALSVGCGRKEGVPMPRLTGYPRMQLPDSVFTTTQMPMALQVNAAASASLTRSDDSGQWVNVVYPDSLAAIYLTFTPVSAETLDGVIDNRVERMALNLSGNDAEMLEFDTPAGLTARVVTARSISTPVQFIATDNQTVVVSGTAFVPQLSASTRDSLRPVVDMLRRDVIHSLKTLQR